MPKAVVAASRQGVGGKSDRYLPGEATPLGRSRSAERWTAAAAIAVQAQIMANVGADSGDSTAKQKGIMKYMRTVLSDECEAGRLLSGPLARLLPKRDARILAAIFAKHVAEAGKTPQRLGSLAKQCWQRPNQHAGPLDTVTLSVEHAPVVAVREPGWWLDADEEPFRAPRPNPLPGSRLRK